MYLSAESVVLFAVCFDLSYFVVAGVISVGVVDLSAGVVGLSVGCIHL